MIKGVITGDIVNSTALSMTSKERLIEVLKQIAEELDESFDLSMELYRGDSFQILVENPVHTLKVAVLLRAGLKANTVNSDILWDARVSVGVGEVTYLSKRLAVSDGGAFRLSGHGLDNIGGKNCISRHLMRHLMKNWK